MNVSDVKNKRNYHECITELIQAFDGEQNSPNPAIVTVYPPKGVGLASIIKHLNPAPGVRVEWFKKQHKSIMVSVDAYVGKVVNQIEYNNVSTSWGNRRTSTWDAFVKSWPGWNSLNGVSYEWCQIDPVNRPQIGDTVWVEKIYANGTDYGHRKCTRFDK